MNYHPDNFNVYARRLGQSVPRTDESISQRLARQKARADPARDLVLDLMDASGLTDEWFAKESGVFPITIRHLRERTFRPAHTTLCRLLAVLGKRFSVEDA